MEFRNFLLAALRPEDAAALVPRLKEVTLFNGQILFGPDDLVDQLYFPSSACLSLLAMMQDGRAVEISTIGRESATGLLDVMTCSPAATRTSVQIGGSAFALPAAVFRARLEESPALLQLALAHVRAGSRQAEAGAACSVAHTADGRLARWLLMTQDRVGVETFPLTQDYLAVMTGVQRSTVSQMAAALKSGGVIDYSRGQMVIRDRKALIGHACECYATVEAQFETLRAKVG